MIVLEAIRTKTAPPDDMPDYRIWKAERELELIGLIRRDEWTGDYEKVR